MKLSYNSAEAVLLNVIKRLYPGVHQAASEVVALTSSSTPLPPPHHPFRCCTWSRTCSTSCCTTSTRRYTCSRARSTRSCTTTGDRGSCGSSCTTWTSLTHFCCICPCLCECSVECCERRCPAPTATCKGQVSWCRSYSTSRADAERVGGLQHAKLG